MIGTVETAAPCTGLFRFDLLASVFTFKIPFAPFVSAHGRNKFFRHGRIVAVIQTPIAAVRIGVREALEAAGVECCYLDGTTTNRPAVISSFKEGTAPVFLISLKAGGFGLNLTEADYCFLLDPWWNPATEAQAVDRTHRIGQTRNVMVYRLIASGTIEEKVMALKARKQELFSSVIDSDGAFSSALSAEDIRALFA